MTLLNQFTSMLQKNREYRLGGDTEKALERNRLDVKHHGLLSLPSFTLGDVSDDPFNLNRPAFQGIGSVPAGSA
jgi:hypothetical protein